MNGNNQILNIAFFAQPSAWIYKIINELSEEQKKKYYSSPLPESSLSIARKFALIRTCVDSSNLEIHEINKILKENEKDVDYCIKTGKSYFFPDIHHIYRLIAYTEAIITNTKSCMDFICRHIRQFYRTIFGERIKQDALIKILEDKSIDITWGEDLEKIRNDLIHHYSAWIYFKKMNFHHKLVIEIPKSLRKHGGYVRFPHNSFDSDEINNVLQEFQKFFNDFTDFLIKKIKEKT